MNAPPRLARHFRALADTPPTDPLFFVCGTARRLFEGDWPCRFCFEASEPFDGIIITDAAGAGEAERLLHERRAWLAPIIDVTGERLGIADFCAAAATPASLRQGVEEALAILDRLLRLPANVSAAQDPETLLLARVYARGGRLVPTYDGAAPQLLRYPQAGCLERPADTAERLTEAGWLSRTFFDRVHYCPSCQSSRLNAREECSACRSPELQEASIINHFSCAHQALEQQFEQGDKLVCPKCRRHLRHFGVDYDRPGSATICRACGQVDADAAVGFFCVDCGSRTDAAVVPTRDWYAYTLTELGKHRLLSGDLRTLRSGEASNSAAFRILLEHCMHIQSRYGRPATILRLSYTRAGEVQSSQGARALALTTRQAAEIIRGELRASDFMIETPEGVLIVMPETNASRVEIPRRRLLDRISSTLAIDLGVDIKVIDPRDLRSVLDMPA